MVKNKLLINNRCLEVIKGRLQSGEGQVCSRAEGIEVCVVSIKTEFRNRVLSWVIKNDLCIE